MSNYESYKQVWERMKVLYDTGYCVSERGLQAALYTELKCEFPKKSIVVEPRWGKHNPDMVIVGGDEITDIFELKFVPHAYPRFHYDIDKLLQYQGSQDVKLNPVTGRWCVKLPIHRDCLLHFVVVGNSKAQAVLPENIPTRILLWHGRISIDGCEWGVCSGIKPE